MEQGNFSEQKPSTSCNQFGRKLERKDTIKQNKDVSNRRRCSECDGRISRESSKSKSSVWKKVMWFTRKSKTAKNDVCQCQMDEGYNPSLEERHSNSWSFTRSASRKFRISSRKRQCKSESSKKSFQIRVKVDEPCTSKESSQPSTAAGSVCSSGASSPTATGSFCDFATRSHPGGKGTKKNKNTVVLTEIAREINPPVKNDFSPLREMIRHPPRQLSKSSSSVSHISRYCQNSLLTKVRRTKSFPGSHVSVSPSKRRFINPPNKTFASFSPPHKQKCYGLRRTATFCGKLNVEFPKACIKKSKSVNTSELMRLEKATSLGEIRDQSGSIVGIVHFYKSPKKICALKMSNIRNEVKNCDLCQEDKFPCNSDTILDRPDIPQDKESVGCLCQKVQNCMENNCGGENLNTILSECDVLNGRESIVHDLNSKETEMVCFEKPFLDFDVDKSKVCGNSADVSCVLSNEPNEDTVFDLKCEHSTSFSSGSNATPSSTSSNNREVPSNFRLNNDTLIITQNISLPSSQSVTAVGTCLESGTKQPSDSEQFGMIQSVIEAANVISCGVEFGTISCANSDLPKQNPAENVKVLPNINISSLKSNLMKDKSSCSTLLSKAASLNISKLETVSEVVELPCHHDDMLSGDHYHGNHVLPTPPPVSANTQTCCEGFDIPCCNNKHVLESSDKPLPSELCRSSMPCKGLEVSEEFSVKSSEMILKANGQCTEETIRSLRNSCVRDEKFGLVPEYGMFSLDATTSCGKSEEKMHGNNASRDKCLCKETDITEQYESLAASNNGDLTHKTKLIHSYNTDSLSEPVNDLTSEVINNSSNSIKLAGRKDCVCEESKNDFSYSNNLGNAAKLVMTHEIFQGCGHSNVSPSPDTFESTRTSDHVSTFDESFCRQNDMRNDRKRFVSVEEFQRGVSSSAIASYEILESSRTSEYTSSIDTSLPPKREIRNDLTALVFNEGFQSSPRCSTSSFPETLESSITSGYGSMCREMVSRKRDVRKDTQPVKSNEDCQRCFHSNVNAGPDNLECTRMSEYESLFRESSVGERDVPIHTWKNSESSDIKSDEIGLPVPGETFMMRTELMLNWFEEFNDEQRNIILKKILNRCDLPQMHLLSVAMEHNLHKTCPPNCQDMLVWLPYTVTLKILMYLDPVSLCRCNQVNRAWSELTDNPLLWQQLTGNPDYQLSEASSRRQYQKFTQPNGEIDWKKVFAERFLLQRNWLNGKYKLRTFEGHNQGIACVQFDDTRIVSGSSDKTIKLWDISNSPSELMLTLEGHSGTVRCLDLNGNRLVSGSTDRTIKVWDLSFASYWAGASCKVTMVGHLHTVRCLQADEKKLVSGSYDKTVKVWDLKTGSCQLTLRGHTAAVLCVQFDDQKIVSGSYDKKIKVWDLTEGTCLMTLDGHQDAVTCLNLTHDGMKIITGSLDYSLKFWDLSTGKCYGTLDWIRSEGHTAVVRCLQVDSWRIVSGGDDKTLKVWELATGQRLLTLRYHSDGVTCMQFNDFAIVSGSYDRTVKLWDFTPKHPYLEAIT